MFVPSGNPVTSHGEAARFSTTHWSVVLTARADEPSQAAGAMAQLCRAYWYPLYAHVRRRGYDHHAAQDLTQEFFARLLEKRWLDAVSPKKGRFRSFLLAAADHFLANDWRKARAAKRGGGQTVAGFTAGRFRFDLTGPPGQLVIVEASPDLMSWLPICFFTFPTRHAGISHRSCQRHAPYLVCLRPRDRRL